MSNLTSFQNKHWSWTRVDLSQWKKELGPAASSQKITLWLTHHYEEAAHFHENFTVYLILMNRFFLCHFLYAPVRQVGSGSLAMNGLALYRSSVIWKLDYVAQYGINYNGLGRYFHLKGVSHDNGSIQSILFWSSSKHILNVLLHFYLK